MSPQQLRSQRFVTGGTPNAFHRAFLYATGLGAEEIDQPFAGLALARNEASARAAEVTALADSVLTAVWAAKVTPRRFVVPVVDGDRDGTRELVADSVELVVRGHWYDIVLGIGTNAAALYGLGMSIARLRVPGMVLFPSDLEGAAAAASSFLSSVGLGAVADAALPGLVEGLRDDAVAQRPAVDRTREILDTRPGTVELPGGSAVSHAAALLHELGVDGLGRVLEATPEDATRPRLVRITITDGPAASALWTGTASGLASGVRVIGRDDRLVTEDGRTVVLCGVDEPDEGHENAIVLLDGVVDEIADAIRASGARLTVAPIEDAADLLSCRHVGRTTHPGLIDSPLRYDLL